MEKVVQRALLTAVADIKLVRTNGEVDDQTVGALTLLPLCKTTMQPAGVCRHLQAAGVSVQLALALQLRDWISYERTQSCISTRLAEIDTLCGRRPAAAIAISATINLTVNGSLVDESAAASSVLDKSLNRNPTHRMLGMKDPWLGSLEQRIHSLLSVGLSDQHKPWLDEVQFSSVAREDGSIPLEELGDQRLSESCCMSGCEPCVWEAFYVEQAACRRTASQSTCKRKAVVLEMQHDKHSTAIADTPIPVIVPDKMEPLRLLEKSKQSASVLLFVFQARLGPDCVPKVPWHVRLKVRDLEGKWVTRAYTALKCRDGRLELLIKIEPAGRCTQALAALGAGATAVQVRGPLSTDIKLTTLLSATEVPVTAVHCLCAGTGIAPMFQIMDYLTRRAPTTDTPIIIRMWTSHQKASDVLLASQLIALQHTADALGTIRISCNCILTRERDCPALLLDGFSVVELGKQSLQKLTCGVTANERGAAVMLICGPDGFNRDMSIAAVQALYDQSRIFVRNSPKRQQSSAVLIGVEAEATCEGTC